MLDKLFLAGLLLVLGLAGVAHRSNREADDRPADRQAIRDHIERIFAAYQERDRATVRATHAPNWRGFIRSSRSIIRGIDHYMQEADPILGGPAEITGHEIKEFDVVFYGDIALVSYIADIIWLLDDVRRNDTLRVLDVYRRKDGTWNQVASNVAAHPDSIAASRQLFQPLSAKQRQELLRDREAVWRAWFAGDRARLEAAVPEDTIAINAGEEQWQNRASTLAGSRQFAESGAKLLRLEFPRTEIQVYGDTAILYTTYLFETETAGGRQVQSGRGTELFVHRNGRWVNVGWHLDSGK